MEDKANGPLYLTDNVVAELLDWDELMSGMERGLSAVSKGLGSGVIQPPRTIIDLPSEAG